MSSAAGMPGAIALRSCGAKRAAVYQRRRPERTAAYQVVRQNLETWLAQRRVGGLDPGSDLSVHPILIYVERDLRGFWSTAFWRTGLRGRAVRRRVRTFR